MNIRTQLLAAAAAIALPAAFATAQTSPPADPTPPVGGNIETGVQTAAPAPETAAPPAEAVETPTEAVATPTATPLPATQQPTTAPEAAPDNAQVAQDTADQTADQVEAEAAAEAQTMPPTAAPAPAPAQPAAAATATPPASAPAQPAATATATPPASPPAQPAAQVTAATAADVQTGVTVRDQQGGLVGTIESVDAQGAVLTTGTARARVPFTSFGRNGQGLVIAMTKAQFEAEIAAQTPSPTPSS